MHMILRTALHLFLARFGPRHGPFDVARARFRVWPTDLDVLGHMNNGKYLSIADVARFELMVRCGAWATFKANSWYPVVASETITFRRSLTLWMRFTVESRILGFDERAVYLEHRWVVGGQIWAQAFVRGRFLRRAGGTVPVAELAEALGVDPADPDVPGIPEWLHAWGHGAALPTTREAAPSVWE